MTKTKMLYVIMAITLASLALIMYANIATNPGGGGRSYDCNIDVKNISDEAAHDLAVVFKGEYSFAYTFDGYAAASFDTRSVTYNKDTDRTTIHWDAFDDFNDDKITKGEIVHVGWKFDGPKTDMVDAYWTDVNGDRIVIGPDESIIHNITTNWRRNTAGGFELNWANNYDRVSSISIGELHAVVSSTELPLGDLNTANTTLNSSLTPVPGGELITIAHGTEAFLAFPTPVQAGDVIVLRYSVSGPGASAEVLNYFQFVVE